MKILLSPKHVRFRYVPLNPTFLLKSSPEHTSSRPQVPMSNRYYIALFKERLIPLENSESSVQSFIISEVISQLLWISKRQHCMFSFKLCLLLKKIPRVGSTADSKVGWWMASGQPVIAAGPLQMA